MDVFCVVPCCAKGDVVNRENDKKVSSTAIFSLYSATIFSPHSTAILHSALHNHFLSTLHSHPFLHTPQSSFSQYSTAILFSALHSEMVENLSSVTQLITTLRVSSSQLE